MELKAVNAIYRKDGKEVVRVEPGTQFSCGAEEAQDYLRLKAAVVVSDAPDAAPAKKKKVAAKAKEPAAPAPEKVIEPAKVTGSEGETGEDELLDD